MKSNSSWRMVSQASVDAMRLTARLLLPVECPGCGLLDTLLCDGCRRVLGGTFQVAHAGQGLTATVPWILAVGPYMGPLRSIILAWKDGGRRDLSQAVSAALYAATLSAPELASSGPIDLVVPVPSTRASTRRRGGLRTLELAEVVGLALETRAVPILHRGGRSQNQVGLSRTQRGVNLRGAFTVRPEFSPSFHRILIVDDIVTTGSTIEETARALGSAGAHVVGAVVLAATPAAPERHDEYPRDQEVE